MNKSSEKPRNWLPRHILATRLAWTRPGFRRWPRDHRPSCFRSVKSSCGRILRCRRACLHLFCTSSLQLTSMGSPVLNWKISHEHTALGRQWNLKNYFNNKNRVNSKDQVWILKEAILPNLGHEFFFRVANCFNQLLWKLKTFHETEDLFLQGAEVVSDSSWEELHGFGVQDGRNAAAGHHFEAKYLETKKSFDLLEIKRVKAKRVEIPLISPASGHSSCKGHRQASYFEHKAKSAVWKSRNHCGTSIKRKGWRRNIKSTRRLK